MARDQTPDPRAEKIKARKERKAEQAALRREMRVAGMVGMVKFFLDLKGKTFSTVIDEDCPACLKIQGAA